MKDLWKLLKHGNKPSLLAAFVNLFLGIIKLIAYVFTGNVAMFAETMHSLGDAANQFFVFIGSALSKKSPTKQFPKGFGRLVNLVCLGAVLIVGILSYETVIEGWHQITHPVESSKVWISVIVLLIGIVLEGSVLLKASKEIAHDAGTKVNAMTAIPKAFTHLSSARPATKLVFMEDLVATSGGVLALLSVVISHTTGFMQAEGIASILIGLMMFYVVGVVFLENARGVIGETDEEMLNHIAYLVLDDPNIRDIKQLEVVKEGESLHVELIAEVDPTLSFAYVDDIRDHLVDILLSQKNVSKVTVSFDEDNAVKDWKHIGERPDALS
ncbi:cation diffusion facilitator family transporter [Rummeliibacillus stabekisii]|uniref:Cation diffusion facilitator family transporter n=1 Tax=Rummeliibacillus stabekisii TaxID=241244 RepID=A0A143HEL2_9BACL|nr:cation diffusion facilitator family transporter [Rummeliibacillus stabekisii]AMW99691.1 cation diffusion facilitator family transporter [Rummeliibacillus stabekisii]